MPRNPLSYVKSCTALVLAVAFVAWQPVMTANMTRMEASMAHHAHMPGNSRHHPLPAPLHCCTVCALACAAAPGIPEAAPDLAATQQLREIRPQTRQNAPRSAASQHRLPFPAGPPSLSLA
jgi:hypothetical protein